MPNIELKYGTLVSAYLEVYINVHISDKKNSPTRFF